MPILTNQKGARKVETQNRDQIDFSLFGLLGKTETTKFPDPNTTIYRVRFQTKKAIIWQTLEYSTLEYIRYI